MNSKKKSDFSAYIPKYIYRYKTLLRFNNNTIANLTHSYSKKWINSHSTNETERRHVYLFLKYSAYLLNLQLAMLTSRKRELAG